MVRAHLCHLRLKRIVRGHKPNGRNSALQRERMIKYAVLVIMCEWRVLVGWIVFDESFGRVRLVLLLLLLQ